MYPSLSRNAPRLEARADHARHHAAWASGDYAAAANALQIVSEELCETVNLCQDERVLDVAAGSFHASYAAARRWCAVTATETASDLARRQHQRAEAAGFGVQFVDADAEALPFPDQSFSAVISVFGAMFAADQERAASEMIRVCRRGRRIGLANWTPDGFIGELFATVGKYLPQGVCGPAPFSWGTHARLEELFGVYGNVESAVKRVTLRARSPIHWVDALREEHALVRAACKQLDPARQKSLRGELLELVCRFNRARNADMRVDAEYLEVTVVRR